MIGASLAQAIPSTISSVYNVVVTPSEIIDTVPNGVYISPTMTAKVYNGTGPYEYTWFYASASFDGALVNPTPDTCNAYIPKFDALVNIQVYCSVVDLGNASEESSSSCFLTITFE